MNTKLSLRDGKKWLPISVQSIVTHLQQLIVPVKDFDASKCTALRKNIAYSFQHLEFLHHCEQDLSITSVIWTQNTKAFVIVACGIIEALFYYMLVSNGKAAKTQWKTAGKTETHEFELMGEIHRMDIEYFQKTKEPFLEQMTFDAMCKRVEKRDLAKLSSEEFYKHLPYLRSLRNRVHIHDVNGTEDTDWSKFYRKDLDLVKKVLLLLLQSSYFPQKNAELVYFLKTQPITI